MVASVRFADRAMRECSVKLMHMRWDLFILMIIIDHVNVNDDDAHGPMNNHMINNAKKLLDLKKSISHE